MIEVISEENKIMQADRIQKDSEWFPPVSGLM